MVEHTRQCDEERGRHGDHNTTRSKRSCCAGISEPASRGLLSVPLKSSEEPHLLSRWGKAIAWFPRREVQPHWHRRGREDVLESYDDQRGCRYDDLIRWSGVEEATDAIMNVCGLRGIRCTSYRTRYLKPKHTAASSIRYRSHHL